MPKVIETTVYTFEELPTEKAKEAARDWLRESEDDQDACDTIKEDASQIGLSLIEGHKHFEGSFTDGAFNCAVAIKENHGKTCKSYQAAVEYEKEMDALPEQTTNLEEENRNAESIDSIEETFRASLENYYLEMLDDERQYRYSPEYVDETIISNEYTFTETGKRFG